MMGKIMKRNDFGKIVNYTMKGNNKSIKSGSLSRFVVITTTNTDVLCSLWQQEQVKPVSVSLW